mgnify:CR=1 FL=1
MQKMSRIRVISVLAATLLPLCGFYAGAHEDINVSYSSPKKYIIAGVDCNGVSYFSKDQIIQLTGLQKGMEVTIPGEDISNIVKRLWMQRFFEDIAISVDSLSAGADSAFLRIQIKERPRVSRFLFKGVKSGEEKDLRERLNFKRGQAFSEYFSSASIDIIKRFYKEKGFQLCDVKVETVPDPVVKGAIRVTFVVDRGTKVKIKTITFTGNSDVSNFKLMKSMKKKND